MNGSRQVLVSRVVMLYYTHWLHRTLTVNINLIWVGYNKTVPLFLQTEVIEQRDAFQDMGKRVSFVYFSNKRPIAQCCFIVGDCCIVYDLELVENYIERVVVEYIAIVIFFQL